MPPPPDRPDEPGDGSQAQERRSGAAGFRQGLRQGEEAEGRVQEGERGGGEGRGRGGVEAEEAAEERSGHKPEPEGRADEAETPSPVLRRGAVRDESLGRGLGAARRAREYDGHDDEGERLSQAEERVGERGAEQAGY